MLGIREVKHSRFVVNRLSLPPLGVDAFGVVLAA